jgi:hypothetical protein
MGIKYNITKYNDDEFIQLDLLIISYYELAQFESYL